MSPSHVVQTPPLSSLRTLLAESPSWERWQTLVASLDSWRDSPDASLLLAYARAHVTESWPARFRQGVRGWAEDSCGWGLVARETRSIPSLPTAKEVWCPPARLPRTSHGPKPSREQAPSSILQPRGLWVMTTPVTEAMWHSVPLRPGLRSLIHFEGRDPYRDRCPITELTWLQMVAFCNEVSRREGLEVAYEIQWPDLSPKAHQQEEWTWETSVVFQGTDAEGYRLPTELEWEYLLHAGSGEPFEEETDGEGWHQHNSGRHLHPVGLREANGWGLYDLLGNVYEQCTDTSPDDTALPCWQGALSTSAVRCADTDPFVVARGGSALDAWNPFARRDGLRFEAHPLTGFRMVRTCPEAARPS